MRVFRLLPDIPHEDTILRSHRLLQPLLEAWDIMCTVPVEPLMENHSCSFVQPFCQLELIFGKTGIREKLDSKKFAYKKEHS